MLRKINLFLYFFVILTLFYGCSNSEDTLSNLSKNNIDTSKSLVNEKQKVINTTKPVSETKQIVPHTDFEQYQKALDYIKDKHYPQAMGILADLNDYRDSHELLEQLRYLINGSFITNRIWAVGAITSDGGVQVAYDGYGENYNFSSVETWNNIVSISGRGGSSIEGLTADGNILTTSTTKKDDLLNSPVVSNNAMANVVESVSIWQDIKSFQAYYPQSAVALTNSGTVYAAYPYYTDGTVKLTGWDNMIAVADGRGYVVGIKADGTVISNNYAYIGTIDTSKWKDIVAISTSTSVIGLKEDETVVSTGLNRYGEGNVSDWKNIISISTSNSYTLGLKSDGTVISTGQNSYGQMDIENWTDIVAIAAGPYFSIGLKSDGTMVLAGDCSRSGSPTPDVSKMKGLYVPPISKNN